MLKMNTYNPLFSTVIFRKGAEENLPGQKNTAVLCVRKPGREVISLMLVTGPFYVKVIFFRLNYTSIAFFFLKK